MVRTAISRRVHCAVLPRITTLGILRQEGHPSLTLLLSPGLNVTSALMVVRTHSSQLLTNFPSLSYCVACVLVIGTGNLGHILGRASTGLGIVK